MKTRIKYRMIGPHNIIYRLQRRVFGIIWMRLWWISRERTGLQCNWADTRGNMKAIKDQLAMAYTDIYFRKQTYNGVVDGPEGFTPPKMEPYNGRIE